MDKLKWYNMYPDTFEDERKALESKGFSLNQKVFEEEGVVEFTGQVEIEDKKYDLRIVYPPGFPDIAPDCISSDFQKGRHQTATSGKMCLHEDWKDTLGSLRGAEIVDRAIEWIDGQLNGFKEEEESDSPEPKMYHINTSVGGVVITPSEVFSTWEGKEATFKVALHPQIRKGFLFELHDQPTTWKMDNRYHFLLQSHFLVQGKCFNVDEIPPYFNNQEEIIEWLEKKGHRNVLKKCRDAAKHLEDQGNWIGPILGIRYPDEAGRRGQFKPHFLLIGLEVIVPPKKKKPAQRRPFVIFRSMELSEEKHFKRVSELKPLKDKHVVIVGVGAIGSPIALELAKAGVGKLTFVDPDGVDVGNVIRHICDLRYVGLTKVESVELVIRSSNPYVEFGEHVEKLWGYNAEDEEVARCIEGADLVVCAVGHTPTERYIDRIAREVGTPVVYTFSTAGAWSGRVFRVIPKETGCYICHSFEIAEGSVPGLTAPDEDLEFYDQGCASPSVPGSGVDTGILSNLAARLSIQTLLADQPNAYQPTDVDHIVWYSQGKSRQLEIFQKKVGKHRECETCSQG